MDTSLLFSRIALSCIELARTEAYYAHHFGFRRARVVELAEDDKIVFLKNSQGIYLELFQADDPPPDALALPQGSPHHPGVRHLSFQVPSVEAHLLAMGAAAHVLLGPVWFDTLIPGWCSVWVRDPDGNVLEISHGFLDDPAFD